MVNGRVLQSDKNGYNSFRKCKNFVIADGSTVATKQRKEQSKSNEEDDNSPPQTTESSGDGDGKDGSSDPNPTN